MAIEIHTVEPDCCGSNLSSQLSKYSTLSTLLNLCAQFTSLKDEEHCWDPPYRSVMTVSESEAFVPVPIRQ